MSDGVRESLSSPCLQDSTTLRLFSGSRTNRAETFSTEKGVDGRRRRRLTKYGRRPLELRSAKRGDSTWKTTLIPFVEDPSLEIHL